MLNGNYRHRGIINRYDFSSVIIFKPIGTFYWLSYLAQIIAKQTNKCYILIINKRYFC